MLVEWEVLSVVDNCVIIDVSSNKVFGFLFEVGIDMVIYIFIDVVGNNSVCIFEIIVNVGDFNFCNIVIFIEDLEEEGF